MHLWAEFETKKRSERISLKKLKRPKRNVCMTFKSQFDKNFVCNQRKMNDFSFSFLYKRLKYLSITLNRVQNYPNE